ncbi:HIT domain-containing protein [candidate division KSB1 bacterium]|nr:HIT domain-containing protein [candidate division KSB1 bacterium]
MEHLWAPWRIEYILQPKAEGCIFCTKPDENNDRQNLIVHRGRLCFVIMNYYPYNNGHLMVIPYRHVADLAELTVDEQAELMNLVTASTKALRKAMKPDGFNVGLNLGQVAGAGVKDHLHFHIVPRWNGDTNFMPVTGHTKVISQALEETHDMLVKEFELIQGS